MQLLNVSEDEQLIEAGLKSSNSMARTLARGANKWKEDKAKAEDMLFGTLLYLHIELEKEERGNE